MDRFWKIFLTLIVVLLLVTALHPILVPQAAEAAHHYKYKVATIHTGHEVGKDAETVQSLLDKYAADGWEFVTVTADGQFIFRR